MLIGAVLLLGALFTSGGRAVPNEHQSIISTTCNADAVLIARLQVPGVLYVCLCVDIHGLGGAHSNTEACPYCGPLGQPSCGEISGCDCQCADHAQPDKHGQCQCNPGYIQHGDSCVAKCPNGSEVNGHCVVTPSCPIANSRYDEVLQVCVCVDVHLSTLIDGELGSCTTNCPDRFVKSNGQCICPTGCMQSGLNCHHSPSGGVAGKAKAKRERRSRHGPLAFCPPGETACPFMGSSGLTYSGYECINTDESVENCGGCTATGEGTNCLDVAGAFGVGCAMGTCEILSCDQYHRLIDGYCIPTHQQTLPSKISELHIPLTRPIGGRFEFFSWLFG